MGKLPGHADSLKLHAYFYLLLEFYLKNTRQ